VHVCASSQDFASNDRGGEAFLSVEVVAVVEGASPTVAWLSLIHRFCCVPACAWRPVLWDSRQPNPVKTEDSSLSDISTLDMSLDDRFPPELTRTTHSVP
jgi:hypothetical protein